MPVLLRDEPSLERAEKKDRAGEGDGDPDEEMDPDRRLYFHLEQHRAGDDDGAEDEDHERRRPVADILAAEVEAAAVAARRHGEPALQHLTLAAARTATEERGGERGYRRVALAHRRARLLIPR